MEDKKKSFFDEIGGMEVLQKVHKIFYDNIYAHNWIGKFFQGIDRVRPLNDGPSLGRISVV